MAEQLAELNKGAEGYRFVVLPDKQVTTDSAGRVTLNSNTIPLNAIGVVINAINSGASLTWFTTPHIDGTYNAWFTELYGSTTNPGIAANTTTTMRISYWIPN